MNDLLIAFCESQHPGDLAAADALMERIMNGEAGEETAKRLSELIEDAGSPPPSLYRNLANPFEEAAPCRS